jgi:hypothetical protein
MTPVGLPRDPAQWLALLAAVAALAVGPRLLAPSSARAGEWRCRPFLSLAAPGRARFLLLASLTAAALSAAYVAVYLRGGPRIIDATSYFLEARAMAEGLFSWPIEAPAPATVGRFLVRHEAPSGPRLAVIFPPGYPALLAAGFRLGAPLAVGPILAALLVVATYALAARLVPDAPTTHACDPRAISVPRLAALFSVTSAALRYHTADTMAHGLAALCFSGALALTLAALDTLGTTARRAPPASRARAAPQADPAALALLLTATAGLLAGWLCATRPVSGLALAITLALALGQRDRGACLRVPLGERLKLAAVLAAATLPGLLLLLAHQRAATGVLFGSSQATYYALSDGPPGCFRYGFGLGVGCLGEHGDFVRAHLTAGYGALAAAGTTLRRLKLHLVDAQNIEALGFLVPLAAIVGWRFPRVRLLSLGVIAQIAAYAPFYFDGNYPGGGARFYADVLPLEHVLAAFAVARFASRTAPPRLVAAASLALGLAGFAFRAGFDHAALRDREGGLPMFEPMRLARAGIQRGLVFLDTDHGFDLAFDPEAHARRAAERGGLEVARRRGDDLDWMLWQDRGRPPAFFYRFDIPPDGAGQASPSIEPLTFAPIPRGIVVIEGASLAPPLAQEGGFALVTYASGTCASRGRLLAMFAGDARDPGRASLRLEVPTWASSRAVGLRLALFAPISGEVQLSVDGVLTHTWPLDAGGLDPKREGHAAPRCIDLPPARIATGALTATGATGATAAPRAARRRLEIVISARPAASPADPPTTRDAVTAPPPLLGLGTVTLSP